MRKLLLAGIACAVFAASPRADAASGASLMRRCIAAAASAHRVPQAVIVILLNVEGGSLGATSGNTNGTVDIGPMQVNQIWIPEVAAHWHASPQRTFQALRDNFCANVEAGTWILRRCLDEAHGDFWEGVGFYHSHAPEYKRAYLQAVLRQVLRMQEMVRKAHPAATSPAASSASPRIAARK